MSALVEELVGRFEDARLSVSHDQEVVEVPSEGWLAFAEGARDAGFEMCTDVTAVDWLRQRPRRYEVVANLVSMQHGLRLRVVAALDREDPRIDSLTSIWPGASFAEREVYDMYGIVFEGHPDLTRILMPDDWEGHPLRKDFGVGSVPVQFKEAHKVS